MTRFCEQEQQHENDLNLCLWYRAGLRRGVSQFSRRSAKAFARAIGRGVELSWAATVRKPDGSIIRPYFELQRSTDLQHWQPVGERLRAADQTPEQLLAAPVALGEPLAFYQLLSVDPVVGAGLGTGGAEVFGYAAA